MGNVVAPPRFVAFIAMMLVAGLIAIPALGWRLGFILSFDLAAFCFLASCWPLLKHDPADMRETANSNDANRALLLGITATVLIVIMAVVAGELMQHESPQGWSIAVIIATLALAWLFSNTVYTLHYAHMFYSPDGQARDKGGLAFPGTTEPDYRDFVYFAFCLGMTFQTSDVEISDRRFRQVVTFQCLAAFVFNLGILAFTISVLSSA